MLNATANDAMDEGQLWSTMWIAVSLLTSYWLLFIKAKPQYLNPAVN